MCRRPRAHFILSALLVLAVSGLAVATDIPQVSSVFASPEVQNPLTRDRLTQCIAETGRVLNLASREAPPIVILQLTPTEAKRLGLKGNYVLNNQSPTEPSVFYEVWLIGPNGLADMTLGVVTVYERHFKLTLSGKERADVVNRVLNVLNATVDVKTLRQPARDGDTDGSR